jgi:hypothetical protein
MLQGMDDLTEYERQRLLNCATNQGRLHEMRLHCPHLQRVLAGNVRPSEGGASQVERPQQSDTTYSPKSTEDSDSSSNIEEQPPAPTRRAREGSTPQVLSHKPQPNPSSLHKLRREMSKRRRGVCASLSYYMFVG